MEEVDELNLTAVGHDRLDLLDFHNVLMVSDSRYVRSRRLVACWAKARRQAKHTREAGRHRRQKLDELFAFIGCNVGDVPIACSGINSYSGWTFLNWMRKLVLFTVRTFSGGKHTYILYHGR